MTLTLQQIEAHLLGAANILRGKTAGQDYKNYILSARRCVTRSRTSIGGSDSNGAESHAKRRFPDSLGVGGRALEPRSRIGTCHRD